MATPAPFFKTITKSFRDVPTQPGVDTVQFCDAAEGLVKIFGAFAAAFYRNPDGSQRLSVISDLFGNPAFGIVQSDLTGNIAKVRARFASHAVQSATLEDMVNSEKVEKKKTATEGLMWLLRQVFQFFAVLSCPAANVARNNHRGLKFTAIGLRRSQQNQSEELSVSFQKAYEGSLRPHHGMMVRPLFALAMKACPYRATFYPKLGEPEAEVQKELDEWLTGLEKIVAQMEKFYKESGHGTI
ncbi:hypothetical protein QFC21_000584 [Naganishia friedmannii]|uniref:Uncharacterized protein n=1 Tax=Naganishia friedmannii TaxID=89922 RepID=A0ACC2WBX2_9TREE|nr:hypothetical protein QFC21_000584 [Naganishia friedmannii]